MRPIHVIEQLCCEVLIGIVETSCRGLYTAFAGWPSKMGIFLYKRCHLGIDIAHLSCIGIRADWRDSIRIEHIEVD